MKVRTFLRGSAFSAALAIVIGSGAPSLRAADGHLSDSTVFVMSTEDWSAVRTSMKGSDQGKFFADPEILRIRDSLKKGVMALIETTMKEQAAMAPEGVDTEKMQALAKEAISKLTDYAGTLSGGMSGRVALSIGIMMDPSLPVPVNLVFEFGGNDEIHTKNQELLDLIQSGSEGAASRASFELHGFQVNAVEQGGMGIFIGRKGDRFIAGLHKAGLADYLGAVKENTVRLGNDAFYKSAMGAVGPGSMKTFLNMQPVWGMAMGMLAGLPTAEGEPNPVVVMQSLGVTGFKGMAASGQCGPSGMGQRSFIGMEGRAGLMRLIPTENKSLAPPPFAPSSVLADRKSVV